MDTGDWRLWLEKRLEISNDVFNTYGDSGVDDAEILLFCALSAIAAYMWPGRGIDKARYVEFLVQFAQAIPPLTTISIPTLIRELEGNGMVDELRRLVDAFHPDFSGLVLTYMEVDHDEQAVARVLAHSKTVRHASYAAMFYEDLRSGLVHEHAVTKRLSDFPMSQNTNVPSYFNWLRPGGRQESVLYLPYPYVRQVVVSASLRGFDLWDKSASWEQPQPTTWWVHGEEVSESENSK